MIAASIATFCGRLSDLAAANHRMPSKLEHAGGIETGPSWADYMETVLSQQVQSFIAAQLLGQQDAGGDGSQSDECDSDSNSGESEGSVSDTDDDDGDEFLEAY